MAAKFEIRSSGGQHSWVLLSQGRTLASGGPYARRAQAEKAIASLRAAVGGATVADLTLKPKAAATTKKAAPAKATKAAKPAKAPAKKTARRTAKTPVAKAPTAGKRTATRKAKTGG